METTKPFTARMLAERWSCSESYIYKLIDSGKLKAFYLGGRLKRITWEEVSRWERDQGQNDQAIGLTPSESSGSGGGGTASAPPGMKTANADAIDLASQRRTKLARSCMRTRASN